MSDEIDRSMELSNQLKEKSDQIEILKDKIENLENDKLTLQDMKDALNDDLTDAQNAAEEAEKERDERTHDRDEIAEELRRTRVTMLEFLRKIEFDPLSECLLCFFDWRAAGFSKPTHLAGCEIKLLIYQLDMGLARPAYAMPK